MLEASIVGIFRMVLIIVVVVLVIRVLRRAFGPQQQRPGNQKRGNSSRPTFRKGDTIIERIKDPKRKGPDDDGDYVDFEEVEE